MPADAAAAMILSPHPAANKNSSLVRWPSSSPNVPEFRLASGREPMHSIAG